ncbi:MAG: diguanylate cyclase [Nitrospiraceae bacterium]|nr:diguanylate cyclase [Nitrospiraceae bacterium]
MLSIIRSFVKRFLGFGIGKKLLLGYLMLIILILIISVYTLSNLERLNSINNEVVKVDVPLVEATDAMVDNLLSQELYAKRHVILKSPEILALFWEKSREFDDLIDKIGALQKLKDVSVDRLTQLHTEYKNLFIKGIKYQSKPPYAFSVQYDEEIKVKQEQLISLITSIGFKARQDQTEKTMISTAIGVKTFKMTAMMFILSVVLGVTSAIVITKSIAKPLSALKDATRHISEGKFQTITEIKSTDELGDLANAFNRMTTRLKKLEEMYLDANPLTRLPGNIAIENILKKKIESHAILAFCLIDLDDFKAFNDRYGYAKGSEIIKATAKIIDEAVSEFGLAEDFTGHIGGDDFVLISEPHRFRPIAESIIEKFDKIAPTFYDPADLERGYIISKTRQGQQAKFPIMSVSIAVVTNLQKNLISPIQIGELAAELKEYAKSIPGSVYVVDRRRKESDRESEQELSANVENLAKKQSENEKT